MSDDAEKIFVEMSDPYGRAIFYRWADLPDIVDAGGISAYIVAASGNDSEAFAEMVRNADYIVTDAEGTIARACLGSYGTFDLPQWEEAAELVDAGRDAEAVAAFINNNCGPLSGFDEAYIGEFDNGKAYAEEYAEAVGMFDKVPDMVSRYFDFDAFWQCELRHDVWTEGRHFFRNI